MRGRNNRKGPNPLTRTYESNGPDVKIRGTPHHIAEKYLQLARDAQSSGDPVMAESYLQHAEHYFRLIASAQQAQQQAQMGYSRPPGEAESDEGDDDDDVGGLPDRFSSPLERFNQQQQQQAQAQFNPAQPFNQQPQQAQLQGGQPQPYQERQPYVDQGGQGQPRQERQFQDRGDRQQRHDRPYHERGDRQQRHDRPYNDRNNQNRFNQNRGYQENRQPREFRNEQLAAPLPQETTEAVGLPSFITSPVRVPIAETEPIAQPPQVSDEPPAENGDGGGFHLRSRRRRRNRGDQGAEQQEAGPARTDMPAGE
jgi:hypothetical protein